MTVRIADRTWESQRGRPGIILKQRLTLTSLLLISAISSLSGCSTISDSMSYSSTMNGMMTGYRNTAMSAKAWHGRKHVFCREKYLTDFCRGFRDGYEGVADGGDGCTPPLAPREYWSWKYQSAEGQAKSAAWFAGYPHGARAAEEDGIGNWTQIQTSAGIQAEYAQFGLLPNQQAGMYPIPNPSKSKIANNALNADNSNSFLINPTDGSPVYNSSGTPYGIPAGTPVLHEPSPLNAPTTW